MFSSCNLISKDPLLLGPVWLLLMEGQSVDFGHWLGSSTLNMIQNCQGTTDCVMIRSSVIGLEQALRRWQTEYLDGVWAELNFESMPGQISPSKGSPRPLSIQTWFIIGFALLSKHCLVYWIKQSFCPFGPSSQLVLHGARLHAESFVIQSLKSI